MNINRACNKKIDLWFSRLDKEKGWIAMAKKKIGVWLLFGVLLCLGCGSCSVNPVTGEKQFILFPAGQDVELGRKWAPQVEKELGGRLENANVQNYVSFVGQKIANVSGTSDYVFTYTVLNNDEVNAFALPGGYVFVTKGMLKQLKSEAQLAAVLGHETAHVTARHVAEAISWQIGVDMLLSAVITDKTPQSVVTTSRFAIQIAGLRFSRADELQSDSLGMDYMVKAGYSPYGMVETMEMLEKQRDSMPIEFLSSHPSPSNRSAILLDRIRSKYYDLPDLKKGHEDYQKRILSTLGD